VGRSGCVCEPRYTAGPERLLGQIPQLLKTTRRAVAMSPVFSLTDMDGHAVESSAQPPLLGER
jgi:hypothetical protein